MATNPLDKIKEMLHLNNSGNGAGNQQNGFNNYAGGTSGSQDPFAKENQKKVAAYFKEKKFIFAPLIIVFIAAYIIFHGIVEAVIGTIMVAVLLYIVPLKASESEIDRYVSEAEQVFLQKGYSACNIDPDEVSQADPILISRYIYGSGANGPTEVKMGWDKHVRSSVCHTDCLYFSDNQVFIYSVELSLIDGKFGEKTAEYYFDNVVSLQTEQTMLSATVRNSSINVPAEAIVIKLDSGEILKIPYTEHSPDIQNKISAAVNMIRMWRRYR